MQRVITSLKSHKKSPCFLIFIGLERTLAQLVGWLSTNVMYGRQCPCLKLAKFDTGPSFLLNVTLSSLPPISCHSLNEPNLLSFLFTQYNLFF